MGFARTDRSHLARWWFTVDRSLLVALALLLVTGCFLSLAASPSVALNKGLATYHFVERHMLFAAAGGLCLIASSFLSPLGVLRASMVLLAASVAALIYVQFAGIEANGARRWIGLGAYTLQPSEFAKPAFAVVAAWLLAQAGDATRRVDPFRALLQPAMLAAIALLLFVVALLVMQPDIGQSVLLAIVWGALFFISGQSLTLVGLFSGAGLAALSLAYLTFAHVRQRVTLFLTPGASDSYQLERAFQSFAEGGFFGRGPGEGTVKSVLPDAHTDFIFAVLAEEYGVIACLGLVGAYAFVVFRGWRAGTYGASTTSAGASRLSIAGLLVLFATQAIINMAVNVGLMPAKGMTLPLVSAGGSSLLATCIAMGFVVALTRRGAGEIEFERVRRYGVAAPAAGPGGHSIRRHR